MRDLSTLPEYLKAELELFLAEPAYVTASETLLIQRNGVQVSLKFQRDEDEFITGKPKFKDG